MRGKSKKENVDTFTITKTDKSFKEKIGALVRKHLFIPDARIGWKRYAVKKGIEIVKEEGVDVILSSSPPHSLQLAAKVIAKKTKKPWVVDFRDPWAEAFWLGEEQCKGLAYRRNVRKEALVLNNVNHFVTVSQGVLGGFIAKYKTITSHSSVIHNGFDEDDFRQKAKKKNKKFTIRYVGTLAESQNPKSFFEALRKQKADNVAVEFWGKFDASIKATVEQFQLSGLVSFHPYVHHQKAVELMQSSDMLLLVIPFGKARGILTGKLYEYMASGCPVLGLGPKNDEAGSLIEANHFGRYFSGSIGLAQYLKTEIELWEKNAISKVKNENVERFSRRYSAKLLTEVFDNLLE